jgi:DNA topoisomerase-1
VTFPLPKARYESVPEVCPTCGTPQVKVMQFKQRPRVLCLDPACPTRVEPEVVVGKCPTGDGGDLTVRRSPNTLKRYVRCTNYDVCGTSYPLPQSGDIEPTDEVCDCGTPKIIVHTRKGPWKICVNPECPLKPPAEKSAAAARGAAKGRTAKASATKASAKKSSAKKAVTKKPAAKKAGRATAARKPAARGKTAGETA